MLRWGISILSVGFLLIGLVSILDQFHAVVFGPSMGDGEAFLLLIVMTAFWLGTILTLLGLGMRMVRRRTRLHSSIY